MVVIFIAGTFINIFRQTPEYLCVYLCVCVYESQNYFYHASIDRHETVRRYRFILVSLSFGNTPSWILVGVLLRISSHLFLFDSNKSDTRAHTPHTCFLIVPQRIVMNRKMFSFFLIFFFLLFNLAIFFLHVCQIGLCCCFFLLSLKRMQYICVFLIFSLLCFKVYSFLPSLTNSLLNWFY